MKGGSWNMLILVLALSGCAEKTPDYPIEMAIETYQPAFRTQAPEPVYSRFTWSHLPQPVSNVPEQTAPMIHPTFSFELPDSNLREALEALSQAIGYRAMYPTELQSRRISLKMVGSVTAILGAIEKQAHVTTALDHEQRLIRVVDQRTVPRL